MTPLVPPPCAWLAKGEDPRTTIYERFGNIVIYDGPKAEQIKQWLLAAAAVDLPKTLQWVREGLDNGWLRKPNDFKDLLEGIALKLPAAHPVDRLVRATKEWMPHVKARSIRLKCAQAYYAPEMKGMNKDARYANAVKAMGGSDKNAQIFAHTPTRKAEIAKRLEKELAKKRTAE